MEPKLLLVEDEPDMLEEMHTYLQREGFRVLIARTGKEALTIVRRKLREDPANPRYIQTVYGFGYRFGES